MTCRPTLFSTTEIERMFYSSVVEELQKKYLMGERQFSTIHLRGADLRGMNLSNADLSGADLSKANLREVNLSGANLSDAVLNESDLSSANLDSAKLNRASLIKTYLIRTNLRFANLSESYLTGAYLTKSILVYANLTGAYLNGAKLTGADLTGAHYDRKTRFDSAVNPRALGLQLDEPPPIVEVLPTISIEELIESLNAIGQLGIHYLGKTMILRYWKAARPDTQELKDLILDPSGQFYWRGMAKTRLNRTQMEQADAWIEGFIRTCTAIIQDFAQLSQAKRLVFPMTGNNAPSSPSVTKPVDREEKRDRSSSSSQSSNSSK